MVEVAKRALSENLALNSRWRVRYAGRVAGRGRNGLKWSASSTVKPRKRQSTHRKSLELRWMEDVAMIEGDCGALLVVVFN